jgi:hypothetical protein
MTDSQSLEIKVNDSSHPYDDPLWYRKFLDWDRDQQQMAAMRTAEKIKLKTKRYEFLNFIGVAPKIAYLMIDGDASENSYLWIHKFSMPTLVVSKISLSKCYEFLKYDSRQYLDWFDDMQNIDKQGRIKARDKIVASIESKNPALYSQIKENKLKLIGFTPRIDFAPIESKAVSNKRCFTIPTLLYWDKINKCLVIFNMEIYEPIILTNPVLRYDDTILNEINGKKESIKGITG